MGRRAKQIDELVLGKGLPQGKLRIIGTQPGCKGNFFRELWEKGLEHKGVINMAWEQSPEKQPWFQGHNDPPTKNKDNGK